MRLHSVWHIRTRKFGDHTDTDIHEFTEAVSKALEYVRLKGTVVDIDFHTDHREMIAYIKYTT